MRALLSVRVRLVVVAVVVVGLAAGGIAYASIPDSAGVIHGCYATKDGSLRVVDTDAGGSCITSKGKETSLTWSSGVFLFANVKSDGTLVSGTATGASSLGTGAYTVSFGQDLSNCAPVAAVGGFPGYDVAASNPTTATDISSLHTNQVIVSIARADTALPVDSSFHLIVVC
jgi:exopolysaccharide biosynthesis protein